MKQKSKRHQVGLFLFNHQDDARSNKHKMPGKYLPTRTLLLAWPIWWGCQTRREYCTVQDLPSNWIIGFLEVSNSWWTSSLNSHFFLNIWGTQNVWPVVDPLRRIAHRWSTVISSVYGVNLDRMMLDEILYVADEEWYACIIYYSLFYRPFHK